MKKQLISDNMRYNVLKNSWNGDYIVIDNLDTNNEYTIIRNNLNNGVPEYEYYNRNIHKYRSCEISQEIITLINILENENVDAIITPATPKIKESTKISKDVSQKIINLENE